MRPVDSRSALRQTLVSLMPNVPFWLAACKAPLARYNTARSENRRIVAIDAKRRTVTSPSELTMHRFTAQLVTLSVAEVRLFYMAGLLTSEIDMNPLVFEVHGSMPIRQRL